MRLADDDIYPTTLPPGYEFVIEDEPEFNPAVHLQLERPENIWMLSDLGYDEKFISRFASPVAMTSAARMLSDEGIAALAEVTRKLQPYIRYNSSATRVPATLRGTTHRSRFIRDLCLSPEITEFFSEMFQTSLMPHTLTHQQGHMNFQPKELGREVDSWHHDATAFDWVLMVHDPNKLKGGRFQIFDGTRQEGWDMVRSGQAIPEDRIITPHFPGAGYACFMQGCAVFHRASRLEELGFRASLVQSYVSRNVSVPDPNRLEWIELQDHHLEDPNYMLEYRCNPAEWARHRAWVAQKRLANLCKDLQIGATPAEAAAALEGAIDDVNDLIRILHRGAVPLKEAYRLRDALDQAQLS
ncbi:HalD/BesD family halogenase [Gluconacetobacter tumulisoli]|uniref:Fe2OG dioxygenase domain-containing protein n=1 Tax=Gluconacetobacter tumulisoli TaxID=1286189 RepID=A0A7W4K7U0_9PROT|nr:hypothetical protein [Gluconacetobacter tumulisoli]MBB2201840.1 hypothetical protein [Gluconacetobacter tumulisoli]